MKQIHRIFRINVSGMNNESADERVTKFKEEIGETPRNYIDYYIPVTYGDNGLEIIETEH